MLVKVPYDYFEEGVNVEFLPISSEQEAQDVLKAYKNQVTQDRTEVRHFFILVQGRVVPAHEWTGQEKLAYHF